MGQARHHYERALEMHLRDRRIPFISLNEARRALLPPRQALRVTELDRDPPREVTLKSFDHVIYGSPHNLLVDIKGRKVKTRKSAATVGRLESWVTLEDVEALTRWQRLFGSAFRAAFVFVYWCEVQPPDALFQEIFEHRGRWYAVRAVLLEDYKAHMTPRSKRWRTVSVPTAAFESISTSLTPSPSREFRVLGGQEEPERFAPALAAR